MILAISRPKYIWICGKLQNLSHIPGGAEKNHTCSTMWIEKIRQFRKVLALIIAVKDDHVKHCVRVFNMTTFPSNYQR